MSRRGFCLAVVSLVCLSATGRVLADGWKAGAARSPITPDRPTWMAGYGSRDKPSEGAVHDIWAKGLALEDPSGRKCLIISLDICGIDRETSRHIRDAIHKAHGLDDSRIVLACSHTHCGPVIGENLITMYKMQDPDRARVKEYLGEFEATVIRVAGQSLERMEPARLAWESGRTDFAVNRRNNKEADVPKLRAETALTGPVDHDVPVLRVKGADEKVKAVVFGYACHCTVLGINKFCGDYAGFAQLALEAHYPGAQAMFVAGCGADQNPLPRRTIELAQKYGDLLATAVGRVLDAPMRPIVSNGVFVSEVIDLRLGAMPTRAQIEAEAKSPQLPLANRAKKLLQMLDRDGSLAQSYPYPVQVWKLGDLTWIFLGGEVVVDFSLRFKRNLGSSRTWVSGYCNDVMAYIPSLRVLKEGGYEGATAMIYYGLPTSWSEDVEEQIVSSVTKLVRAANR